MKSAPKDIPSLLRQASTHALMDSSRELVLLAADEIERLRGYRDEAESDAAVARLLVDRLRLTDEEREAVETAALEADARQHAGRAAILRGLLDRMDTSNAMNTITKEAYEGDVVSRLRNWRGLHLAHAGELFEQAADEIDRLREAIRRLADQGVTLSVQGGRVFVDLDGGQAVALDRTPQTQSTPSECSEQEQGICRPR